MFVSGPLVWCGTALEVMARYFADEVNDDAGSDLQSSD
jgi:hypothetical protein